MARIRILDIHIKKLFSKALFFFVVFGLYTFDPKLFQKVFHLKVFHVPVYQIAWAGLMIEMLFVLVPRLNKYVSCGKCYNHHHEPVDTYKEEHLDNYMNKYNRRAAFTFILWMVFIGLLSLMYYLDFFKEVHIVLFVVFLYFLDYCFITIWCPFKAFLIKNKCCSSCRIYNWGHAMIFSPFIMIHSFWTYSLLALAVIIMLYWEYAVRKYPERFSEITNQNLQCHNCGMKCYKN